MSNTKPFLAESVFLGQGRKDGDITSPILPIISSSVYPVGSKFFALTNGVYYIAIEDQKEPRNKIMNLKKLDTTTYSKEIETTLELDVKGNLLNAYITSQEWDVGPTEPAQLRCVVYDLYNPPNPKFTFYLYRKYNPNKVYTAEGCPVYGYDSGYGSHYIFPLSGQGDWGIVNSTTFSIPVAGTNRSLKRVRMYNATWLTWWPYTKEGPTGDWELQRFPDEPDTSKRVWGFYWCVNSPSPFSLNWRWPYEGIPCWSEHGGVNSYMIAYPEGIAP